MTRPSLIVVLAFSLSPWLAAQSNQPADPQANTPVFRTNTRAVVVDVVVNKGDEAVTGLHAKDFVILEDGKPQSIDFFEEHTAKTLPPGAIKPLPAMPPGVYTNVPPAPPSDSVNILLLDSLNTDKEDQVYVHNEIMHFLQTMQPGTKVAIFTLSSQLRMVQGFTTDTSVLTAALNDPKYGFTATKTDVSRSVQDKLDDVRHLEIMQQMLGGPGRTDEGISAIASFQRDFSSFQTDQRVSMTLEALQNLARYFAQVPGRKNLIWFSSSFPVSIFPRAGETQRPNQTDTSSLRDYGRRVKETADLLTVSQIAVYPVGAEGVMSEHIGQPNVDSNRPGPVDYEGGGLGGDGLGRTKAGNMTSYTNESAARSDKIMSMEQLAADTGGKAYFNTNDLNAAMQHAIADGSHYYTIAYSPTNKKMDGSYRRIEIKIPDTKYKLAYRRGYNADKNLASDTKSDNDPLHPLMAFGMPNATQLLFAVHVVPADPQPAPNAPHAGRNPKLTGPVKRYGIDFMIRWTDVKLDTTPDGRHTGKLQVELLAHDREGRALNWSGGTQMMDITPEIFAAVQRSGIPAHVDIDVPADTGVYLQTGVYDWATGKAGTLEVPLQEEKKIAAAGRSGFQP